VTRPSSRPPSRPRSNRGVSKPPLGFKTALVLAGGAARGSYEVGVVDYILTRVGRDLASSPKIDILCGTSVGAINACVMASYLDDPAQCARIMVDEWTSLRLEELVRPNPRELLRLVGTLVGRSGLGKGDDDTRRGGLLDPTGIEDVVGRTIRFDRIAANIASGVLTGITVSTTHVATGRTVIFVEHGKSTKPRWSQDPTIGIVSATIRPEHALASAALPLLFPAVRIDGDFYCDGGLRQNVPLSPARRLGADGLVVVNPRYIAPLSETQSAASSYPSPLFLLGKAMNALLLDRIDNDLDRLKRINAILDAGTKVYGPGFVDEVNRALGGSGAAKGIRSLSTVHIRASEDIGAVAADYVRSQTFAKRSPGILARALRRIGEWQGEGEADLLSYLVFDGGFAAELIALGRRDAKAHHDELCAFFTRAKC
jgi:NTE family protein